MILCARCKKRPAVVFVTRLDKEGEPPHNEGYCIQCAKELHIPNVENVIKQMGLSDEELDAISSVVDESGMGADQTVGGMNIFERFLNNAAGMIPQEPAVGAATIFPIAAFNSETASAFTIASSSTSRSLAKFNTTAVGVIIAIASALIIFFVASMSGTCTVM